MRRTPEPRTPPISVRLEDDQIEQIQSLAKRDRVSRMGMIRKLVDLGLRLAAETPERGVVAEASPRYGSNVDEPRELHSTEMEVVAYAPAGPGREPEPKPTGETVMVVNEHARPASRHGWKVVRIIGDSMEPKFADGDLVLLEPTTKAKNKQVVYALLNGEPQAKQLRIDKRGKMILMPLNLEKHEPIQVGEEDEIRVIGILRDIVGRRDA